MPLRPIGLGCGLAAPVVWLGLIAAAGAARPDFSHFTDYISELAERGSTTEVWIRHGAFVLTGVLYLCFGAAVWATFRRGWPSVAGAALIALDGVGRLAPEPFPASQVASERRRTRICTRGSRRSDSRPVRSRRCCGVSCFVRSPRAVDWGGCR